jgi:hypothetical protein
MKDAKRVVSWTATVAAWLLLAVMSLALGLACAPPAPVVQGPVVSVDKVAKTITLQDEKRPGEAPLTYDISKAEIGAQPEVGDIVRLAYRTDAGQNVVLRVMNLTQQKERDAKGS